MQSIFIVDNSLASIESVLIVQQKSINVLIMFHFSHFIV